jgi:hypothetical protein
MRERRIKHQTWALNLAVRAEDQTPSPTLSQITQQGAGYKSELERNLGEVPARWRALSPESAVFASMTFK